jgi:hypothetical protein
VSFAPLQSGKLSRTAISLDKDEGSTGAFVVKLLTVDSGNGFPGTKLLASMKVRNDRVRPGQLHTLVASFKKRHAVTLVQGTTYAVVISRPNFDLSRAYATREAPAATPETAMLEHAGAVVSAIGNRGRPAR